MHGSRIDGNRVPDVFERVLKVLLLFNLAKVAVPIEIVHRQFDVMVLELKQACF